MILLFFFFWMGIRRMLEFSTVFFGEQWIEIIEEFQRRCSWISEIIFVELSRRTSSQDVWKRSETNHPKLVVCWKFLWILHTFPRDLGSLKAPNSARCTILAEKAEPPAQSKMAGSVGSVGAILLS